jgi:hypothetical protein
MPDKNDLADWVIAALVANGGRAKLVEIAKHIWTLHESDLKNSGDLLYTWQYDMRWAATELRRIGRMVAVDASPRGTWELK